jgi:hypothetical protein
MKMNIACTSVLLLSGASTWAQINPASSTTSWTPIQYGPGNIPDPTADQQTGSSEGDIVGNLLNPSLYTAFYDGGTPANLTDGQLAFRFRVGMDKNPAGYTGCAFVGLDLDGNGVLDVFAGVNNSGSTAQVGLWWAGSGANVSPSTTSIASSPTFVYAQTGANYSWLAVSAVNNPSGTTLDVDGGGKTDYYLSFAVPFADLVSMVSTNGFATFNEQSFIRYVAATATQANSLNQDLNGVNGGVNSSATWSSLGAMSSPVTSSGFVPVPEPATHALFGLGLASVIIFGRRPAKFRSGGRR